MGFLPKVGARYSSLAAVKLDVLERAAPLQFNFGTKQSSPGESIDYHCSRKDGESERCTCRVIAKRISTGEGFEIVEVEETHSCLEEDRTRLPNRADLQTESKIYQLRSEVERGERKRMKRIREEENRVPRFTASESEEEGRRPGVRQIRAEYPVGGKREYAERSTKEEGKEDNSKDSSEEEIVDPRSPHQLPRATTCRSTDSQATFSRKTSAIQQENELRFPRAIDVQDEIDELLSSTIVNFPLPHEEFDDSRKLFIRLYSYARQRGFTVHRRSAIEYLNWFKMSCCRSSRKSRGQSSGKCQFEIVGKMDGDGQWEVEKVGEHNHRITEPTIDLTKQTFTPSNRSFDKAQSFPRKRPQHFSSSPPNAQPVQEFDDDHFLVPSRSYRTRPDRPARSSRRIEPPPAVPPTEFSSILRSFLPQSSSQLSLSLTVLASLGIDNIDTLTSILLMEEKVLGKVLSEIEDDGTRNLLVTMAADLKSSM